MTVPPGCRTDVLWMRLWISRFSEHSSRLRYPLRQIVDAPDSETLQSGVMGALRYARVSTSHGYRSPRAGRLVDESAG